MAFPPNPSTTWNYKVRHVQQRNDGSDYSGGNFVRGASILIAAGPRRRADAASNGSNVFGIGLLQTGSISQQKQLEEIFEIGSERRYFVPGRTFFQLQAQRIMIDGGSLMAALYHRDAAAFTSDTGITIPVGDEPGISQHYINLASLFFNTPTGLLVVDNNSDDKIVGGAYLEDCYIQTYNRQIAAQQTVVAEQCLIRFDKIIPMSGSDISAMTGGNTLATF